MSKLLINITNSAHQQLEEMFATNSDKLLQISLNKKGCGGNSYEFDWINKTDVSKFDETQVLSYGTLVIKADSILNLLGSTLDWVSSVFESKFVWTNPHAKSICGCGKSVGF